ncbi:MAG: hypothetical protein ACHQRM_10025 [Bacteroidia bacterium]
MKKYILTLSLVLTVVCMKAQNLNAYSDILKYFRIFDDGKLVEAEYLPVTMPQVGGNSVAYVDNSNNFKIYYNGESHIEADNKPDRFYETDNLVAYDFNKRLEVFEQGQSTLLCYQHGIYAVGDSVVAFFDTIAYSLKVYKNQEIKEVEALYGKGQPQKLKAGDNIIAYVGYNGFFKVYFRNRLYELESYAPNQFKAGCNTVAYVDRQTQNFKVFYRGNLTVLESFPPASFKVGDDLVAYIDNTGNFKVFYMGELVTIQTYEPKFYDVQDHVAVFGDDMNFFGYYNGKATKLESYIPESYQLDFNSIAYKDRFNKLRFFSEGNYQDVSNSIINSYQLTRNVLMYSTDVDEYHFFCNGKNY